MSGVGRGLVLAQRRGTSRITGSVAHDVRRTLTMAFVCAFLVGACYGGPGPEHYAAILDDLAVPPAWTHVKTETRGPNAEIKCDPGIAAGCPGVTRFYLVQVEPSTAFRDAEQMARAAGFHVDDELIPACNGRPTGPSCSFNASRPPDKLRVSVYQSPEDAGLHSAPAGSTAVVVTAER